MFGPDIPAITTSIEAEHFVHVFRTPFDAGAYSASATSDAPVREIATFSSGGTSTSSQLFFLHDYGLLLGHATHLPQALTTHGKGGLRIPVGYTGGGPLGKNPDYKSVCTGVTNHAEAVKHSLPAVNVATHYAAEESSQDLPRITGLDLPATFARNSLASLTPSVALEMSPSSSQLFRQKPVVAALGWLYIPGCTNMHVGRAQVAR
ncbi:hypothetical protein B0H17DRAFT_1127640 [Mycena rosella]|uniref:peptide-methionine (S)-S-oxide reductase n=1 Tax=Mycena rosella TaxID=1033263 RepID=A0AAD7DZU6_MYCRO|nr:hypothetical protein B0H17DRAFT_1127640 [Mycena rosella]